MGVIVDLDKFSKSSKRQITFVQVVGSFTGA